MCGLVEGAEVVWVRRLRAGELDAPAERSAAQDRADVDDALLAFGVSLGAIEQRFRPRLEQAVGRLVEQTRVVPVDAERPALGHGISAASSSNHASGAWRCRTANARAAAIMNPRKANGNTL